MSEIQTTIENLVNSGDVVLFMKGDADQPQCGFSATVVRILDLIGVPFKDYNVLTNMAVRDGIKEYSNWPTIPQLYVKGEFVGGCDIVREMYEAGELTELMQAKGLAQNQLRLQSGLGFIFECLICRISTI